jgi:regulator of nucleoside diphosphate kinase
MSEAANKVVLLKEDYDLLTSLFATTKHFEVNELENYKSLIIELNKAVILNRKDFPIDVVRLNSIVTVKDEDTKSVMMFQIVLPIDGNIKNRKVSVLAPLGTALIGFKKGDRLSWPIAGGEKHFSIIDVSNHFFKTN